MNNLYKKLRALTSWISLLWPHTDSDKGNTYTPWDPWTIIAWGKSGYGHNGGKPIAMCVHYAVIFSLACTSLGIRSRNVVVTESLGTDNGHFLAEVWNPREKKWFLVDPNLDLFFVKEGKYLSLHEVSELREDLYRYVIEGPGTEFQRSCTGSWIDDFVKTARCLKLWGIWNRNDYLSHPECTGN